MKNPTTAQGINPEHINDLSRNQPITAGNGDLADFGNGNFSGEYNTIEYMARTSELKADQNFRDMFPAFATDEKALKRWQGTLSYKREVAHYELQELIKATGIPRFLFVIMAKLVMILERFFK